MVDDLEEILAYEVQRSGSPTTEATLVLETAADESGQLKHPKRRRARTFIGLALVAVIGAFGLVAGLGLLDSGESGNQLGGQLTALKLSENDISAYDPPPGDEAEHDQIVGNIVDGLPDTAWDTESYRLPDLGEKQGVGLLIDAGKPVAARELEVSSSKAGYDAEILGANKVPTSIESGWTKLAEKSKVAKKRTFKLDTVNRKFRYYLVWITRLGGSAPYQAAISNVQLLV